MNRSSRSSLRGLCRTRSLSLAVDAFCSSLSRTLLPLLHRFGVVPGIYPDDLQRIDIQFYYHIVSPADRSCRSSLSQRRHTAAASQLSAILAEAQAAFFPPQHTIAATAILNQHDLVIWYHQLMRLINRTICSPGDLASSRELYLLVSPEFSSFPLPTPLSQLLHLQTRQSGSDLDLIHGLARSRLSSSTSPFFTLLPAYMTMASVYRKRDRAGCLAECERRRLIVPELCRDHELRDLLTSNDSMIALDNL